MRSRLEEGFVVVGEEEASLLERCPCPCPCPDEWEWWECLDVAVVRAVDGGGGGGASTGWRLLRRLRRELPP